MKQWQLIAGFVMAIILIILGGFREIVFVNINEQLAYNTGMIDSYRVLDAFSFLKNYSNEALVRAKWILTISFALLYLSLAIVTFLYILKDRQGVTWMLVFYLGGIMISGGIYTLGKLLGDQELGYTLSRVIMGGLQSPFPLMLMIPARMLSTR